MSLGCFVHLQNDGVVDTHDPTNRMIGLSSISRYDDNSFKNQRKIRAFVPLNLLCSFIEMLNTRMTQQTNIGIWFNIDSNRIFKINCITKIFRISNFNNWIRSCITNILNVHDLYSCLCEVLFICFMYAILFCAKTALKRAGILH